MSENVQRVVVTGASGFIGGRALPTLLKRGYEVHAVDLRAASHPSIGVNAHACDLFAAADVRSLMEEIRPSHLLHFAWNVKHGEFWTSPDNLRWVQASLDLYQAFRAAGGRRMVTAGTCAEYDWSHGRLVEGETPRHPATLYGTCKDALNRIASAWATQEGVSSAWGRVFLLYGPGENPRRLVAGAIESLLKDEDFACSDGRQRRDFLHVQDVADAFVSLLDSDLEGSVNIASGQARPVAEVLSEIGRQLGREARIQLGARPAAPHDPPVLEAAVDRLRDELGWAPSYSLNEGIADTIAWWRARENKEA